MDLSTKGKGKGSTAETDDVSQQDFDEGDLLETPVGEVNEGVASTSSSSRKFVNKKSHYATPNQEANDLEYENEDVLELALGEDFDRLRLVPQTAGRSREDARAGMHGHSGQPQNLSQRFGGQGPERQTPSGASVVVAGMPPKFPDKRNTFSSVSNDHLATEDAHARRTRSLNAPSPIHQFGPCGRISKNSGMVIQIQDPAFQRLTWYKTPLTVLIIKKRRDISVLSPFVQLTRWLIEEKRMVVHVEAAILDDPILTSNPHFSSMKEKLQVFREGRDDLTDKIDFIICLGGDGTLLYASGLFQQSVPPVMAFHLGSLGFLTPFRFDNFQEQVTNVLEGNAALTLRSRLRCILKRRCSQDAKGPEILTVAKPSVQSQLQQTNNSIYSETNGTKHSSSGTGSTPSAAAVEERNASTNPNSRSWMNFLVLNEVVVDRGPSPYLSNLDLFIDGKHVTVVQGDGLIVSTPTGSTAYAVAAGASMIHPSVPAIMITPICPHSLSFRPIVVPAGVELKIKISPDSRNTAWVSFDGRSRQELQKGDTLCVTTSVFPVPSICAQDQIQDWFDSLADCLQWNVRKRQKQIEDLDDNSDCYEPLEVV